MARAAVDRARHPPEPGRHATSRHAMTPSCTRLRDACLAAVLGVSPEALRGFLERGEALPAARTPAEQRAAYDKLYATLPDNQSRGELWSGYRDIRGRLSAAQGGFEGFSHLPLTAGHVLQHTPETRIDGAIRGDRDRTRPGRPPPGNYALESKGGTSYTPEQAGRYSDHLTSQRRRSRDVRREDPIRPAWCTCSTTRRLAARALRDLQGRHDEHLHRLCGHRAGPSNGCNARREPRNPHHEHRTRCVPGRRVIPGGQPVGRDPGLFDACRSAPDTPRAGRLARCRRPRARRGAGGAGRRSAWHRPHLRRGCRLRRTGAQGRRFGWRWGYSTWPPDWTRTHSARCCGAGPTYVGRCCGQGVLSAARVNRQRGGHCVPYLPLAGERYAPGGVLRSADRGVLCRPGGVHPRLGFGRDARRDASVPTRPERAFQPDFLAHILPGQMAMARAARPGLTRFYSPQFEPGELELLEAGEPTLTGVGYYARSRSTSSPAIPRRGPTSAASTC